ncbi:MAG: ABC transporter ATP-binding protein [Sphaerochaetaceae bacterium]
MADKELLLSVRNLKVAFHTREATIYAVNGISYDLAKGETIGIVGESGSGKTVGCMSMLKLISMPPGKIEDGQVLFEGRDLVPLKGEKLRQVRGKEIGVIFQDPMTAFNQVMTIGDQMVEGYMAHFKASKSVALEKAIKLFELVGIPSPERRLHDYPSQFSGGMRQRAMIAMALMCDPKLLIADEPTTALDVTIQAQIVDLVKSIRDKIGTSIIWISHDLGVVAGLADRVLVMYAGYIIESAMADDLYEHPRHPYTQGLLGSLPSIEEDSKERLVSINGMPPYMNRLNIGCPFAPRCEYAIPRCLNENPVLKPAGDHGHMAACHRVEEGVYGF